MYAKVLDGASIIRTNPPKIPFTFENYAHSIILPYITRELQSVERLDVVWDVYNYDSLREVARDLRVSETRFKAAPKTTNSKNWNSFLGCNEIENKQKDNHNEDLEQFLLDVMKVKQNCLPPFQQNCRNMHPWEGGRIHS